MGGFDLFFAGLLVGRGCFYHGGHHRRQLFSISIQLKNNEDNLNLLESLQEWIGVGHICENQDRLQWRVTARPEIKKCVKICDNIPEGLQPPRMIKFLQRLRAYEALMARPFQHHKFK